MAERLRCHRCSHDLDKEVVEPVRIWGIFRRPPTGDVPVPAGSIVRRCRSCSWVNVFEPGNGDRASSPNWRQIELKSLAS